jgi:hypothetical protein
MSRRLESVILPTDLRGNLSSFLRRFGTDVHRRSYVFHERRFDGLRCAACDHDRVWSHKARLLEECVACNKRLSGTIFEQDKPGLARWFLVIHLVTSSNGGDVGHGVPALDWFRQLPDGVDLAAQVPDGHGSVADPAERSGEDTRDPPRWFKERPPEPRCDRKNQGRRRRRKRQGERLLSGRASPGHDGRCPGQTQRLLWREHHRPAASVATNGWSGYGGLAGAGYDHTPLNLGATWGDASLRLPAIHFASSQAKRWLPRNRQGALDKRHLLAYLNELVFRLNGRGAKKLDHRFIRLIERAVAIRLTTYCARVTAPAWAHG